MNIEILFRDGTKLKLVGYELFKVSEGVVSFLKGDNEQVTVYTRNVSYIHSVK